MSRNRVVVASTAPPTGSHDPTIVASRALLGQGAEVVHLGPATTEAVARAAVAEDAVRVVLVGADARDLAALRAVLAEVGVDDVEVDATP